MKFDQETIAAIKATMTKEEAHKTMIFWMDQAADYATDSTMTDAEKVAEMKEALDSIRHYAEAYQLLSLDK